MADNTRRGEGFPLLLIAPDQAGAGPKYALIDLGKSNGKCIKGSEDT